MTQPVAFESMEIVIEIAANFHLEFHIAMTRLLEMPYRTHETAQFLYGVALLTLGKLVRAMRMMMAVMAMMMVLVMTMMFVL